MRIEKANEEKEPDRYTRVMARLGTELQSEDKSGNKKRVPSQEEKEEGNEIEEKRRKMQSVTEDGEMRSVQPQQQQSEALSSSSTSERQQQDEWECPRCNQLNPMSYKYCPWCPNDQGACRNPNIMDTNEQPSIPL